MKKVTVVLLLVSLLLLGLNDSGLSEGFEGFDIELIPQEGESADPDHEGLEVRLGTWAIYDSWNGIQEESNVWAVLDVTIQNWTINTLNIQDSLSAVLIYHESFEYPATLMFSLNNLGMIERLDGQLGFMVPEIVALAQPDELSLTIRSLDKEIKVESANLVTATAAMRETLFPFNYNEPHSEAIDFYIGEAAIINSIDADGNEEQVARRFHQTVQIINWTHEEKSLSSLSGSLVYLNKYKFNGNIICSKSVIRPLETVSAALVLRIPTTVAEANPNEAELWISLDDYEIKAAADMKRISRDTRYLRVDTVSGAQYGFSYQDGWYTSQNKGRDNSYSLCVVRFKTAKGSTVDIEFVASGEGGYDFGVVSQLDRAFSLNNDAENSARTRTIDNTSATVSFEAPDSEEHTIWIKYRKDGSSNSGSDSLRFRIVNFNGMIYQ